MFGFEHGDTQLFIWGKDSPKSDGNLLRLHTDKVDDHDLSLSSIDYHMKLKLFLSGGHDQFVRIFNQKK